MHFAPCVRISIAQNRSMSILLVKPHVDRQVEHDGRINELLAKQAQLNAALDLDKHEAQVVAETPENLEKTPGGCSGRSQRAGDAVVTSSINRRMARDPWCGSAAVPSGRQTALHRPPARLRRVTRAPATAPSRPRVSGNGNPPSGR